MLDRPATNGWQVASARVAQEVIKNLPHLCRSAFALVFAIKFSTHTEYITLLLLLLLLLSRLNFPSAIRFQLMLVGGFLFRFVLKFEFKWIN